MQIVCVAHSYPRTDQEFAGVFIHRLNLALRERKHSVKVIVPADRGDGRRDRRQGVGISRVRYAPARFETLAYSGTMAQDARGIVGMIAASSLITAQASEIRHLNRVAPVDLVHAHWWVPGGVSAWLASKVGRIKYVVTLHGTDVEILRESMIARRLAKSVLRNAAVVTAVSSYLADEAARVAGIDPTKIIVQPMPVDVDRFQATSRGGAGIVTIGRLIEQKNLGLLLEAMARLKGMGNQPHLRIIGDGPKRQFLEMRARGLKIEDQVQFVGNVPPDEIPRQLADADLMVFPAIREGLGLVAAEALLMGVPVVATQSGGGIRDIVPPTGPGRLVAADDPHAMAVAINDILRDPSSLSLAARAGQSLRKRLEPGAVAKVFEGIYEKALYGKRPRANA